MWPTATSVVCSFQIRGTPWTTGLTVNSDHPYFTTKPVFDTMPTPVTAATGRVRKIKPFISHQMIYNTNFMGNFGSFPGTAMNFNATWPIFALKSSVSEVFSTIVNLLSLGDIWRWTLYNHRKNPAISSTEEFRRFSGVATITLGPFSSLKINAKIKIFTVLENFYGFWRFLIHQRNQLSYNVLQIQSQLEVFRKLFQDQLKMTFFSFWRGKIMWLIFQRRAWWLINTIMSHSKGKIEEFRENSKMNRLRFFVIAKSSISQGISGLLRSKHVRSSYIPESEKIFYYHWWANQKRNTVWQLPMRMQEWDEC